MKSKTSRLGFQLETKVLNDKDEPGTFEGHASVFGEVDSVSDVVMRGAFKDSIKEQAARGITPHLLWQHDTWNPIGVWKQLKEDRTGLYVKGELLVDDVPDARRAYALLKADASLGLSIGYNTVEADPPDKRGIRKLRKLNLWEVSLVSFPALQSARIEAVKGLVPFKDLPFPKPKTYSPFWNVIEAEQRVREWAGAEDEPNEKYKKAFLWCDPEREDDFDAYRLQIADVEDGKLVAVPRALAVAAADIMGYDQDLELEEAECLSVRATIARYYLKMREEFEDEHIATPWEKMEEGDLVGALKDMRLTTVDRVVTKRKFEDYLRDEGFSTTAAKAIASGGFVDRTEPRDEAAGLSELLASIKKASAVLTVK